MLGRSSASLEIGDLPIVPADMRATALFTGMKRALSLPVPLPSLYRLFKIRKGSGWELLWRLVRLNKTVFAAEMLLSAAAAVLYYGPAFFLEKVVKYLEDDPLREDKSWGLIWAVGLFGFNALGYLGKLIYTVGSFQSILIAWLTHCSDRATLVSVFLSNPSTPSNPAKLCSIRENPCAERCCLFRCPKKR